MQIVDPHISRDIMIDTESPTETEWRIPTDSHEASCVLLHTSTEKCALVWDVKKTCIRSATAAVLIFQAGNSP